MAALTITQLKERMKQAWSEKELWRGQLDDAYALCFPTRNRHGQGHVPGDEPGSVVYDSTLMASNINLANKIQADVFPAFDEWLKLVPGVAFNSQIVSPQQRQEVQGRLDQVNAVHEAAMDVSNFDQTVNEMLLDYNVGQGTMMVLEGENPTPLQYVGVNPAQVAMDEGPFGTIGAYFRKHPVFPRNVRAEWGTHDTNPSIWPGWWDEWANDVDNNKTRIIVEEASYFSPEEKTWYFVLIAPSAEEGVPNEEVVEGGVKLIEKKMEQTVWLSPRWNKEAGEVYGRGPVLYALPNAKVLNRTIELILKNASVTLFPPMTYIDDMEFNPAMFSMAPGYLNAVARNGGSLGKSVEPLQIGGDLRMAQLVLEELKASIKKLMLDDQLPPPTGAVHSPTEIMARQRELQRNESAPFGRLNKEFIRPLAQKNLNILSKKGFIESIEIDGLVIDLQVMNPQADIKNEEAVLKLQRTIEVAQSITPELPMLTLNIEDIPRYVGEKMGIPNSLLRSTEEMNQMQDQAAQIQQQQQQQQEEAVGV